MSTTTALSPRHPLWTPALDQFAADLIQARYAESTRDRLVKHLSRFAREVGIGPWDVTPRHVEEWLDTVGTSAQVGYGYRTSLRTFYRMARRAGRIRQDPTELISGLQRWSPAPSWRQPIKSWEAYLRSARHSETTIRTRIDQLTRLSRQIGMTPWEVTSQDLTQWMASHQWSRETARSTRSGVRGFYAWAVEAGHLTSSPAETLPHIPAAVPCPRPAPEDDYRAALAAAPSAREALMVRLAAELGLRRAEVCQVHARDVLQEPDGWTLMVHGKGGKTRFVPLPVGLARELRSAPAGWVFPGKIDGHLSPETVGTCVSRLLPPGITMHALRHRFASRAYLIDQDVLAIQQLLGHSSPATTQRYVHVTPASKRRLVEAVAR